MVDSAPTSSTSSIPTVRAMKRKLDDAFQTLDDAVSPAAPFKKPFISRNASLSQANIYSTLAKYGIGPKSSKPSVSSLDQVYSKSTPNLTAILTRHAKKSKAVFPLPQLFDGAADYRPSSTQSFLSRLATFKLATYSNKPKPINAVAAAGCGWTNDAGNGKSVVKDRLKCGICGVSWVVKSSDGMSRDAANALIERHRQAMVGMHKDGCPWKARQCDASIYRIPLQAPTKMARDLKGNALFMQDASEGIEIRHPLTPTQLSSFVHIVRSVSISNHWDGDPDSHIPGLEPSETASLMSLFGWSVAPVLPERARPRNVPRSSSLALTRSSTPSPSAPSTPAKSCVHTPLQTSRSMLSCSRASSGVPGEMKGAKDIVLWCSLCQRRVGLWAFRDPQRRRQFDLLGEHRPYCPYVVKESAVPNCGKEDVVEGWKAVLGVIWRCGVGWLGSENPSSESDGVGKMMESVKAKGGKKLLNYVRELLG